MLARLRQFRCLKRCNAQSQWKHLKTDWHSTCWLHWKKKFKYHLNRTWRRVTIMFQVNVYCDSSWYVRALKWSLETGCISVLIRLNTRVSHVLVNRKIIINSKSWKTAEMQLNSLKLQLMIIFIKDQPCDCFLNKKIPR